jgi:hypothetical protein
MIACLKMMVKGRDFAEAHDIVTERAMQESRTGFWRESSDLKLP